MAARLADDGHSVLILEKMRMPSSTISTHFFRGAWFVSVLDALGVLDDVLALGAPKLTREWHHGDTEQNMEAPPQKPGELGYSLSVRREPLDPLLLERARSAGAEVRSPGSFKEAIWDGDRVIGVRYTSEGEDHEVRAGVVIGADGRHSAVADAVQPKAQIAVPPMRALYYRYVDGWDPPVDGDIDAPEFSMVDGDVGYVFPSDGGVTCLAVSVPEVRFNWMRQDLETRFLERLLVHPGLADRVKARPFISKIAGAKPEANWVREPWGPGWALVGDAGMHIDPVGGYGMDCAGMHSMFLADSLHEVFSGSSDEDTAMRRFHERRDAHGMGPFTSICGDGS